MGKKKKEKIIYIDDGRTLADMSGVQPGFTGRRRTYGRTGASFKEVWNTYWSAFRMMLLPTLVIAGGLTVVYGIMALIFYLA